MADSSAAQARSFDSLDGLRGVAALAVIGFHLEAFSPLPLPHAYLAVDLFFALSGFVLAHAYDARFARGLSTGEFLLKRWLRLFPLLWLGTLLGLTVELLGLREGPSLPTDVVLAKSLAMLLTLPFPSASDVSQFDLNDPIWSLQFELLANALFALLWSPSRRWLQLTVGFGALGLIALIVSMGDADFGSQYPHPWVGLPRVVFAFFLGVLMRRHHHGIARRTWWALLLPVLLLALLAIPFHLPAGWLRVIDLALCLVALPSLLWLATRWELPPQAARALGVLGACSYAAYAVHYPLVRVFFEVARPLYLPPLGILRPLGAAFLLGIVPLAYALHRWYDEPARRWLHAQLARRRAPSVEVNAINS